MNHRINGLFKNICSPCVHSSWNDYGQVFLRHSANLIFACFKGDRNRKDRNVDKIFSNYYEMRLEDLGSSSSSSKFPSRTLQKKTSRAFLCISTTLSFSRWSFAHYFFLYILFFVSFGLKYLAHEKNSFEPLL